MNKTSIILVCYFLFQSCSSIEKTNGDIINYTLNDSFFLDYLYKDYQYLGVNQNDTIIILKNKLVSGDFDLNCLKWNTEENRVKLPICKSIWVDSSQIFSLNDNEINQITTQIKSPNKVKTVWDSKVIKNPNIIITSNDNVFQMYSEYNELRLKKHYFVFSFSTPIIIRNRTTALIYFNIRLNSSSPSTISKGLLLLRKKNQTWKYIGRVIRN